MRVVFYAVNGTGVGHVTRLLAIARWMRRYAAALDTQLEVWFLTSSEADGLVFSEGFAAFKIPSKTIVAEAGIDRRSYLALAKQWVWHALGLLRPDLLVVDTFPRGSFGELLGALDLCRRSAFVYRPVRAEVASRPDFQAMLSAYDLVVVPEGEGETPVVAPLAVADRIVHVGPVLSRERWELLPRDVARARLGVAPEAKCVFVSAGGGGDPDAEEQMHEIVRELAADPALAVVVGAGPLYRGRPFAGVTTLVTNAAEHVLAFDAAVCAAGYNTFGELMFAGVPTAFLPQDKLADDQRARAERAVASGAAIVLERGDDPRAAVHALLARPDAPEAARSLVPENGARLAAAELLRLVCPPASIDRVEEALDDAVLAPIAGPNERAVLALGHRLASDDPARAIDAAARLLAGCSARQELRGIVDAVVRGLGPDAPLDVRASTAERVLGELGELGAGDGAAARIAVAEGRWGGETSTDAAALARALRATNN